MEAVVKKWGNSLGIRIPNLIARELSLKDGSCVGISYRGKEIIIKPIQKTGCPKCWAKSTNKTFMTKLKQQANEKNGSWYTCASSLDSCSICVITSV